MAISKIESASLATGVPSSSQLPAGTVLQVATAVTTTDVTVANNTTATLTSLTFTPISASSKILIMTYCGQVKKVDSGGTWGNLSVRDSTEQQLLYTGAIGYPSSESDSRIVVAQHSFTNSWVGAKTLRFVGTAAGGGSIIYSFQNNESRLTLMEIAA